MAEGIVIPVIVEGQQASLSLEALAKALADATKANEQFNASQKKTVQGAGALAGVFQGIAQGVGQFVAAKGFEAVNALAASFSNAVEKGSQLTNLSSQLNTTSEALQVLQAQASAVDVPFGVIQRSLNITQRNLSTAGKAFREFGIDVSKFSTDSAVRFGQIVDEIRKIESPTKQAAAAFKLLGDRSGQVLRLIRSDLGAAAKDARDFGLIIGNEQAAALEKFGSQTKLLGQVFQSLGTNLVAVIAQSAPLQAAIRAVTVIFGTLSKFIQENQAVILEWVNFAVIFAAEAVVTLATTAIPLAIDAFTGFRVILAAIVLDFKLVAAEFIFVKDLLSGAGFAEATSKAFNSIADATKEFGEEVKKAAAQNVDLQAKGQAVIAVIEKLKTGIVNAGGGLVDLGGKGKKALDLVGDSAETSKQAIKNAEAATKAFNAALEAELALFQKRQQLASIGIELASAETQRIAAAQAAFDIAEEEFLIKSQQLQKEIELAQKKKEAAGADAEAAQAAQQAVDAAVAQLATTKETLSVTLQIANAQLQLANIQQESANRKVDIDAAAKLRTLAIELASAQQKQLTGQLALNEEHRKTAALLESEFRHQQELLDSQLRGIAAEKILVQARIEGNKALIEATKARQAAGAISEKEADKLIDAANKEVAASLRTLAALEKTTEQVKKTREELEKEHAEQVKINNELAKQFSLVGQIVAAFGKLKEAKGFGETFQALGAITDKIGEGIGQTIQGVKGLIDSLQVAGSGIKRAFAVGQAGAKLGETIGGFIPIPGAKEFGKLAGAVVGGIVGLLHKPASQKAAEAAGKFFGEKISNEMGKEIVKRSKELGISIKNATLLSLPEVIASSKKAASSFSTQINALLEGIASGAVPAAEGIAALGESFNAVADEALKAGRVGDKVLVDLIKKSRALGVESPEIKAFVEAQLDAAVAGVNKFIDALSKLTTAQVAKVGADAATVFGATFAAVVSEKGILGAVDSLSGSFDKLKKSLTAALGADAANTIVAPFAAAFAQLGEGSPLRPIFEAIDGLSQAFTGLANAAFLDVSTFRAATHAIGTLFDEAIAGGADAKTALTAIAPSIQAAISAAEQFGIPLDADTQRLKDLAEQNGIAFKVDPIERAADAMLTVADALDRIFHLGLNVRDTFAAVRDVASQVADETSRVSLPEIAGVATVGPAAAGGAAGPRVNNISIVANISVGENPLVAAQTLAEVRRATVGFVADAFEDRLPALIAAAAA